jgi:hypothetical protein
MKSRLTAFSSRPSFWWLEIETAGRYMAYAGIRPRALSHRAARALLLPHRRRVRTGDEWRGRADADADADADERA